MSKYIRANYQGDIIEIFDLTWGELTDHFVPFLAEQFILAPDDINSTWKYENGNFIRPEPDIVLDEQPEQLTITSNTTSNT